MNSVEGTAVHDGDMKPAAVAEVRGDDTRSAAVATVHGDIKPVERFATTMADPGRKSFALSLVCTILGVHLLIQLTFLHAFEYLSTDVAKEEREVIDLTATDGAKPSAQCMANLQDQMGKTEQLYSQLLRFLEAGAGESFSLPRRVASVMLPLQSLAHSTHAFLCSLTL